MVVLFLSGLLLAGWILLGLPVKWLEGQESVWLIVTWRGAALLAWLGFAATLINCVLLAQVGGWRKSVAVWAAILLALTDLYYRGDWFLAVALRQELAVPLFMRTVGIFLKPLAVVALSLVLSGRHRWAVMGLGITAFFFVSVFEAITIAEQMKILNPRLGPLQWVQVLSMDGAYLLCFAAAAVSLLAVLRNPGQATSTPASPTPAPAPQPGGGGGRAKAPTNRILYVALGLFFGWLGVHNFLAGYTRKAVVQLLISFTVVGICITTVWALVDICTVTEDADGVPFT